MMYHQLLFSSLLVLSSARVCAQDSYFVQERPRPETWSQLVPGARFMDRFLPMQGNDLSSDTWGADAVRPRLVDNGVEDRIWSYWGGNIVRGDDSRYHLMVAAWLEASDKGHHEWPRSYVIHTIGDTPHGPFRPYRIIGRGHNPEVYRTASGQWVLYVIDGRYVANDLMGEWTYGKFEFNTRDRHIIEGLSNLSFARRPDGSVLMVDRGGGIWVSRDGLSAWQLLTDKSAYPPVHGQFEDPVLWRDSEQYHLIVNDWQGRIAYYLRSIDGVNWQAEEGEAYVPGIARHPDGSSEEWFKYERPKVFQDEHGRVTQMNFAVIDTLKNEDKPYDHHSSKNICVPMNPGVLMSIEAMDSKGITVRIHGEKDRSFIDLSSLRLGTSTDVNFTIDMSSLRLGTSADVNFGNGATVVSCQMVDAPSSPGQSSDLLIRFAGRHGLNPQSPSSLTQVAKLLGRYKDGTLFYGYARLPQATIDPPILSARKPVVDGLDVTVEVQNFGLQTSKPATLRLLQGERLVAKTRIPALQPYEATSATLRLKNAVEADQLKTEIR